MGSAGSSSPQNRAAGRKRIQSWKGPVLQGMLGYSCTGACGLCLAASTSLAFSGDCVLVWKPPKQVCPTISCCCHCSRTHVPFWIKAGKIFITVSLKYIEKSKDGKWKFNFSNLPGKLRIFSLSSLRGRGVFN